MTASEQIQNDKSCHFLHCLRPDILRPRTKARRSCSCPLFACPAYQVLYRYLGLPRNLLTFLLQQEQIDLSFSRGADCSLVEIVLAGVWAKEDRMAAWEEVEPLMTHSWWRIWGWVMLSSIWYWGFYGCYIGKELPKGYLLQVLYIVKWKIHLNIRDFTYLLNLHLW